MGGRPPHQALAEVVSTPKAAARMSDAVFVFMCVCLGVAFGARAFGSVMICTARTLSPVTKKSAALKKAALLVFQPPLKPGLLPALVAPILALLLLELLLLALVLVALALPGAGGLLVFLVWHGVRCVLGSLMRGLHRPPLFTTG
jgi:hypothetical protein